MKVFTKIQNRIIAVLITLAIVRFIFIFLLLPYFVNTSSPTLIENVIILDIFFILFFIVLIYFLSKNFNNKIEQEQENTVDIINRYEALSMATNDAIWDHDLITGKTFYNERLIQMFGYANKDLQNNETWWMDNIHPDDKKSVAEKIKERLNSTHNLWLDQYKFRCKNGEYKIVRDRSYIVRNSKNVPTRLIGAMNDITAEKNLQDKILEEKLNNKNKLGKAIIQTQEEERKNIRYELHEDVNQILAAIKMSIQQNINRLDVIDPTTKSVDYLDDVINKIRKISNQLSPGAMEYFGLISSINEIIIFNETNYPVKIWLEAQAFEEEKIENALRIFMYRIVQDMLATLIEGSNLNQQEIGVRIENISDPVKIIFKHTVNVTNSNDSTKKQRFINIKNKLEMYNGSLNIYENVDGVETCTITL